jgi:hypothetical protein
MSATVAVVVEILRNTPRIRAAVPDPDARVILPDLSLPPVAD